MHRHLFDPLVLILDLLLCVGLPAETFREEGLRLVSEDLLNLDVHLDSFIVRHEELVSRFINFLVCLLDGIHTSVSFFQLLVDLSVILFEDRFSIVLTLFVKCILRLG